MTPGAVWFMSVSVVNGSYLWCSALRITNKGKRYVRKFAFVATFGCGLAVTFAPTHAAPWAGSCMFHCAGMELVQYAAPKENEPDDDNVAPPERDPEPDTQPPGDDGANQDVIPPPDDGRDPPGCVFTKQPLELLV